MISVVVDESNGGIRHEESGSPSSGSGSPSNGSGYPSGGSDAFSCEGAGNNARGTFDVGGNNGTKASRTLPADYETRSPPSTPSDKAALKQEEANYASLPFHLPPNDVAGGASAHECPGSHQMVTNSLRVSGSGSIRNSQTMGNGKAQEPRISTGMGGVSRRAYRLPSLGWAETPGGITPQGQMMMRTSTAMKRASTSHLGTLPVEPDAAPPEPNRRGFLRSSRTSLPGGSYESSFSAAAPNPSADGLLVVPALLAGFATEFDGGSLDTNASLSRFHYSRGMSIPGNDPLPQGSLRNDGIRGSTGGSFRPRSDPRSNRGSQSLMDGGGLQGGPDLAVLSGEGEGPGGPNSLSVLRDRLRQQRSCRSSSTSGQAPPAAVPQNRVHLGDPAEAAAFPALPIAMTIDSDSSTLNAMVLTREGGGEGVTNSLRGRLLRLWRTLSSQRTGK